MIIIDERVEETFLHHIEKSRALPQAGKCLHLTLSPLEKTSRIREVELISQEFGSSEDMAFFLPDGESFLFSSKLSPRLLRPALAELNTRLGYCSVDLLSDLMDVHASWAHLFSLARERVHSIHDAANEQKRLQAQAHRNKLRQDIIHTPVDEHLINTIEQRRNRRDKPVVLLVEDEAFSRKLVEGSLSELYDVESAEDGQSAIMNYARLAPDIMFLDIELPDISGHDVLQRIEKMDPHAYVVMLSGNADKQHITTAMAEGARGFIAKPFTREKLRQYIENAHTIKNARLGVKS